MEKYIPKSVLVAEIERRIVEYKDMKIDSSYYEGMVASLEFFRDEFINTIEVKEVDLDGEVEDYIENTSFATYDLEDCDIKMTAKHFFELGMQVSNKTQKGE